jgi:hypothetical protein
MPKKTTTKAGARTRKKTTLLKNQLNSFLLERHDLCEEATDLVWKWMKKYPSIAKDVLNQMREDNFFENEPENDSIEI